MDTKEDTVDLEALEQDIEESQAGIPDETEIVEEVETFDLDEALDSVESIKLEGKITQDVAEEKAAERGWREDGKDKYGHKISAIEFLERTPLFHKMDLMRGDIDDIKQQNRQLVEQSKLVAKKAIDDQAALNVELKQAREQLLDNDILDRDDIKELKTLDKKIEHSEPSVTQAKVDNEAIIKRYDDAKEDFVKDNDWYESDFKMTKMADEAGTTFAQGYLEENGILPEPSETFRVVMDKIKKEFPDMGKAKRPTRVASRNNRTVTSTTSTKHTIKDLPDDMQAVARNVMEAAGLSEEEYLKTYEF